MKVKNIYTYFTLFLIFILYCKNDQNQKISTYILSTNEVGEFCSAMIPCIKEEVSNTFKDLPQQREYLLSKTNQQNCVLEQSTKLDELLKLSKEQILSFYQEINNISKDDHSDNKKSSLENLNIILNQDQKLIIEAFIQCRDNVINTNDCSTRKNILKTNEHCLKIYSYNTK